MKNDDANDKTAQGLVDSIFGSMEPPQQREQAESIPEEELYKRVTKDAGEIITSGLEAISDLKTRIGAGAEPDMVEAFSTLIASTTNAIEVLNKIQLQTKKAEAAKELEKIRHENKTAQIEQKAKLMLGDGQAQGNTNILIATREDIMSSLLKPLQAQARIMISNEKVLEATVEPLDP